MKDGDLWLMRWAAQCWLEELERLTKIALLKRWQLEQILKGG